MNYNDYKKELKQKLWTAIDGLADDDGFVLIATSANISFTPLKSAGWDEHTLEIEPFDQAQLRAENQRAEKRRKELITEQASLTSKISYKKRELAQIEAAIGKLTE